jgi:hypothetical protein
MPCGGEGCRQGRAPSRCNCEYRSQWEETVQPLPHGEPTGQHRPVGSFWRGVLLTRFDVQCLMAAALILAIALVAAR